MTNKLVPEIRFDGFCGEWKQKDFQEQIKLVGGATPSKSEPEYWGGDIVWLSSQEIKNKYVSEGTYKITEKAVNENRTKIVSAGTPLIVTRSGILAKRFPISISLNKLAINQDIKALIFDKNTINTEFIVADIISKESYILRNIVKSGTTVQSINLPDLNRMLIELPDYEEQQKIGEFFKNLDDRIALQQQQIESLKESKQGFLQKLFPKDGERVPEIRFDGFSGKWELKTLGEVLTPGNKLAVSDTSAYKRITVKLNKKGVEETKSDRKLADTRPFYQRYSGELIIGKQNYFNGSIAIVPKEFNGYICSNAIMSFNVVNNDPIFIYSQISQSDYISKRSHIADGTGQKELSEKNFLKFEVLIPELEEQQKISEFFKNLDDAIEAHEKELELLQTTKKGFLQKMFV